MPSYIYSEVHTLFKRSSKFLISDTHTLLDIYRIFYILSDTHTLFSINPPSPGFQIFSEDSTLFPGHIKKLWTEKFALAIQGQINRNGWRKGGKTITWQYNPESKEYMCYSRNDYSYIRTPEFQSYIDKLKQAAKAWNDLSEDIKEKYRHRARGKQLYGYNIFVKEWFKSH